MPINNYELYSICPPPMEGDEEGLFMSAFKPFWIAFKPPYYC